MIDFIDRSVEHANRYRTIPVPGTNNIVDLVAAPGEVSEEGTFINKRASQLLQADRRYYPAKEPITAGDVVDVVGGEVGKTVVAGANVENSFSTVTTDTKICRLNDDCSIASITSSSESQGTVVLVDNSSGKQIDSSKTMFYNSSGTSNRSLARLSDTKFVVGYVVSNKLCVKVGTVTGTSISFGSELSASNPGSYNALVPLSEDSVLLVAQENGMRAKMLSVSGSSILVGLTYTLSSVTSASYISATRLLDLNGNKRVCVCFADGSNGNKGKAVIATVKPDNSVEWGTVVTFNPYTTSYTSCCTDGEDVIVSYSGFEAGNNQFSAKVLSVAGATITVNSLCTISRSPVDYPNVLKVGNGIVCVGKIGGSESGNACVLRRDGNELSAGNFFRFNQSIYVSYISSASIGEGRFIVSYANYGNNNYGTATILAVHNDQIAGSFTDLSSQAIALQDAAAGQQCEVIFDGVAQLPGMAEGDEINSPGVYAYCPQDGWVWVRPEWDGAQFVTGGYIGSGTSGVNGPTKIDVGFRPGIIMVFDAGGSYNPYFMSFSYPQTKAAVIQSSFDNQTCTVEWGETGVSFYSSNSSYQLNKTGTQYKFVAFKLR